MTSDLGIYDSQVHVWGANTPERPWEPQFAGAAHGPPEVTAGDILMQMDRAGVRGALLVPPSFEGDRNDFALAAARASLDRFRVLGRFPVADPAIGDAIEEAMDEPAMLGVRLTFNAQAASWLTDGRLDWFWGFASKRDIPVSLFPPSAGHVAAIGEVAGSFPELKLSIDHMALGADPADFDSLLALDRLRPLARHDRVAVKVSALPNAFPTTYSAGVVNAVVDRLLAWFGADRLFWGSDLTRSPAPHDDYAVSVETFLEGIAPLSPSERALLMGDALRAWFDWS